MKLAVGVQSSLAFSVIGKPAAKVITTTAQRKERSTRDQHTKYTQNDA